LKARRAERAEPPVEPGAPAFWEPVNGLETGQATRTSTGRECRFAVGLGSNLGDRLAHLRSGVAALERHAADLAVSSVYETDPVGLPDQPRFLNACCVGRTRLSPRQLLSEMQDAERRAGRRQGGPRNGPRPLDLDLLLYSDLVIDAPGLQVPHPRLRERAFVLVPLCEIAGGWTVPGAKGEPAATVTELTEGVLRTGMRSTELEL